MDVADPDGTVLRFVAGPHTGPPGTFAGVELDLGRPFSTTSHAQLLAKLMRPRSAHVLRWNLTLPSGSLVIS